MYIVCCDFFPAQSLGYKQEKYECVRVEYNKSWYTNNVEKDSFFVNGNANKIRIIAYKKELLKELKREINILNSEYSTSADGSKWHYYIKKLNSGKNYFKLIPTGTGSSFHSMNKALVGYYFDIKPTKNYKEPNPISDLYSK
jgi:hypothetical protein